MDTGAACRTFNVLLGKLRGLTAALFPDDTEPAIKKGPDKNRPFSHDMCTDLNEVLLGNHAE
jgi:hypothetical protein